MGRHFRGILNDLKRRPEDAAAELDIPLAELEAILEGRAKLSFDIIERAAQIWPVNLRDFFPIQDDAPEGVLKMASEESAKSARIMNRGGIPYYEYRDTAMTRIASFRPEWIKELCVVEDSNPENPKVQWNKGHFMHQFTYFIGPVNFYYLNEVGEKCVAEMQTGDSMYISPYVPHTFTTRSNEEGKEGLILALTFGNSVVGDSLHELEGVGFELGQEFFLDQTSSEAASLLQFYRNAISLSIAALSEASGITVERIKELEESSVPKEHELKAIANALSVNVRDLLPLDKPSERVVLLRSTEARSWAYPEDSECYKLQELANTSALPHSKALLIEVEGGSSEADTFRFGLHQYIYNSGSSSISIHWKSGNTAYQETLEAGSSAYVKPFVSHSYSGNGQLLTLRIGGHLAGEPMRELSSIGRQYAERVIANAEQWFKPESKS